MPKVHHRTLVAIIASVIATTAAITTLPTASNTPPTGLRERAEDAEKGLSWVEECMADDDQLFVESRLQRYAWDDLIARLTERELVNSSNVCTIEEKVLTFLYVCGQGISWRNVKYRCGRSLATITR